MQIWGCKGTCGLCFTHALAHTLELSKTLIWTSEHRKTSITVSLSSPFFYFPPWKREARDILRYLEEGWKELTQCWNTADRLTPAVILGMSMLKPVFKVQVLEEMINSRWLFTILVLPLNSGFALLSFILTKEKALTGRECPSALPNLYWFCETKFLAILSSLL